MFLQADLLEAMLAFVGQTTQVVNMDYMGAIWGHFHISTPTPPAT